MNTTTISPLRREIDWSINLEDEQFADNPEQLIADAVKAVSITAPGRYVNLVTHQAAGHPLEGLIGKLEAALAEAGIADTKLVYINACGCGGFVTRVYRG